MNVDIENKPTKYVVALVILNDKGELFVVKRPAEGELPNIWGLPATVLKEGELPEKGTKRVGREKLGCKIKPVKFIGAAVQERKDGFMHLFDYQVKIVKGEPDVYKAKTKGTKYINQMWVKDFNVIMDGAKKGSLCEQIFLYSKGLWKRKLIAKVLDQTI
jgi:ADP-ribose pyrophosphatase YjhB (NUDIX family)